MTQNVKMIRRLSLGDHFITQNVKIVSLYNAERQRFQRLRLLLLLLLLLLVLLLVLLSLVGSSHPASKIPSKKRSNCVICEKSLIRSDGIIQSTFCNGWIHRVKCCSLSTEEFIEISKDVETPWCCPKCSAETLPFYCTSDNELFIENLRLNKNVSEDLNIIPQNQFKEFLNECNNISNNLLENVNNKDLEDFPNPVNSKYHDIHQFNQIKPDPISSLGLIHTNLASIGKHFDDLNLVISLLKFDFHIIGISEHKIQKENDDNSFSNINLEGYHPFVFDPTETSHGGTGIYIKDSLVYVERDDLKFNSPSNYESTSIEVILPDRKNMILGCIYRHPTSTISIQQFINESIEPLLDKISAENKFCSLMGDFNIDLLKTDTNDNVNAFYNNVTSHFFAPYILQPTRPKSKTLIDNILINSVEYPSHSGNLTVQISDHLLQFVILEGFFKELAPKKINIFERNYQNFNEREFNEALTNIDWDQILSIEGNDPNISMNNLH